MGRRTIYETDDEKFEENVKGAGIDHFGIFHLLNFERRATKNEYKGRIFLDKNKSFPIGYLTAVLPGEG